MNKEIRSELEIQGHLLETTRAEMENFKGAKSATSGGKNLSRWCVYIVE
jgi:hypothetical protein